MRTCTAPSRSSQPALTSRERLRSAARLAVAAGQGAGRVGVVGLADQEDDLGLAAGLQLDGDVERGAGVDRGADAPGQVLAAHRGRGGERAVPAEEGQAVGRERARPSVDVGERHPGGEVGAERVPRQQGAGLGVDLGDDLHGRRRRG